MRYLYIYVYLPTMCFLLCADKLFKGKEESQNGGQAATAVAKCLNATSPPNSAAAVATQQKTELNNQRTHRRSFHGPPTAAGSGPGGNGSTAGGGGDLIHLPGPLTEDAVLRALQSRFCATQMFVSTYIFFFFFLLNFCELVWSSIRELITAGVTYFQSH